MGRYPATPLEDKLVWMRERQRRRQEQEARPPRSGGADRGHRGTTSRDNRARLADAPPALPQMLRVKQVAKALGVSVKTVRRWFRRRAVIVRDPGARKSVMLIPQRALDDWIREHTAC